MDLGNMKVLAGVASSEGVPWKTDWCALRGSLRGRRREQLPPALRNFCCEGWRRLGLYVEEHGIAGGL